MNLFEKTPLARRKAVEWADRDEEFVKRAPSLTCSAIPNGTTLSRRSTGPSARVALAASAGGSFC